MSFNTISVIGLGYIGLPTAAMFAACKKQVIGVDINQRTVDIINRGEIHIVEPELDIIVHAAVTEGYLKAVTSPESADAFLIAVPTPFKPCLQGAIPQPDLQYIESAAIAIAPVLSAGDLVILESTSPVGATEQMTQWLAAARPDLRFPAVGQNTMEQSIDINIAHCPERVLPGRVVHELVVNDRVIGGMTAQCSARAVELYQTFVEGECVVSNARTAEMAKLTENASRDVSIAFANELSMICDQLDIDVWELIALANRHPRVNILQPGPGVGGHCIAVDPWFIVAKTPEQAQIIHTARKVNDSKPHWVVEKVKLAIAEQLIAQPEKTAKDLTIACLGLAFKADIDDLRESPALNITQSIATLHPGSLFAVEPNISDLPDQLANKAELMALQPAIDAADIVVVLVDHKAFKGLVIDNGKSIIDTKGIVQLDL